jgi:hypothetical protein
MDDQKQKFQLSNDIDHYLATLSKLYTTKGERRKLEVIVNAQVRVNECWTSDNFDGGTYGHALYLTVPEPIYLGFVEGKDKLQNELRSDINKIQDVQNEYIAEVFLEMEKVKDRDWRRESGSLHSKQRTIAPSTIGRIWRADAYRVFLCHKAEVKKKVAELKEQLEPFGISAFVAHQDIHPTKEWQEEIENALASMDAFFALLTEKFHESQWTDQEVGYALARGLPMIAVKLGRAPYGFIGKFQALTCSWSDAPVSLVKLLIKHPRMLEAYISAVPKCESFGEGNVLSEVFPNIEELTEGQANGLAQAFNNNNQLQGSFGFNGAKPYSYGDGLAAHLSRMTKRNYIMTSAGRIKLKDR